MKIFILRHEDRTQDCSFYSPLTKEGLDNAIKLIHTLSNENINLVISSPYIRCLQTVYPYCKEKGLKINIEYGLGEIQHEEIIAKRSVGLRLPEYLILSFNADINYKSIIQPEEINYPETEKQVSLRTRKVLRELIKEHLPKDIHNNLNILLVTHQTVCIQVLKIVNKSSLEFKDKIKLDNYEKGKVCLVYDSDKDWTFKEIN
jgi:broad specificity phosphatase PhoE